MKRLFIKLNHLSPVVAILIIGLLLCFANYTPQTFLSGWDTLHPEFNFSLNFTRTFFGVFRPEQGLGALSSHAHMVELVRIPILYLFHFFVSLSMIRYLFFFLCLLAGPIGMYYFLKKSLIKKKLPSFLGALFYLLNLGTFQTFLVPLEMFTVLYAVLPFAFYLFFEYLLHPSRKKLFFFSIVILLSAQAAYASTLWFVFFASLILFFLPITFLYRREAKGILKRFFLLLTLTIIINSFWLLPNFYFALNGTSSVTGANINKLFSEEAFLKNKEFGNIKDILFLKTFYFDWGIYNYKTSNFEQLTKVFQEHLENPWISSLGYIFASFFIVGYIYIFKSAKKYFASFTILLLFCLFFLINQNFPFTSLFVFLQNNLPLFKEAMRFPGDKILNIFIFLVSIFFAYSQDFLLTFFKKIKISIPFENFLGISISAMLIIYTLPFFSGNLIHPFMKTTIPLEYFRVFSSLSNKSSGRVANFPVSSPWGWVYHNWYGEKSPSYQGAGFLYFGMESPIMERDFDRWNPLNEQYFKEISHAVYTKDQNALQKVLVKYDISDLLVDTSVINPGSDPKSLYFKETFELLDALLKKGFLSNKEQLGEFLTIYKVSKQTPLVTNVTKSFAVNSYKGSYYEDTLLNLFESYYSPQKKLNHQGLLFTDLINNESKIKSGKITTDEIIKVNLSQLSHKLQSEKNSFSPIPSTLIASKKKSKQSNQLTLNLYPQTPTFDKKNTIQPISSDFDYPLNVNPILSINNEIFPLQNLTDNSPTVLGVVFMNPTVNTIGLFNTQEIPEKYLLEKIPFSFSFCNGKGNNATLNILSLPTTLSIQSEEKNSVCIVFPLNFIKIPKDSLPTLITIDFSFENKSDISICLADNLTGLCRKNITPLFLNKTAKIQFALSANELFTTQLILTVGKGQKDKTLHNMSVSSIDAFSQAVISEEYLKTVQPSTFSSVTIPKTIDKNYYFQAEKIDDFTNDCQKQKNISKKTFENDAFNYISERGSFCDHFSFPNLPHALSYLVYITSRNNSGLPLNICITNYTTRRCDIYAKLTNFKSSGQDVFLLPESDLYGNGYDINIENIGIPGSPSNNSLYNIAFVPFPYEILSTAQEGTVSENTFPGKIVSSEIINPSLFKLSTTGEKTLATISYAYNEGFHAYNISCQQGLWCFMRSFVIPFFGNEIEHVKVDGWKNGWIINDNNLQPTTYNLVIVYLPQYLEYIGFLLLFGTFIIVSVKLFKPSD